MSFDPNLLHNNGHNGYPNGTSAALRETGVIEKLLTSYGFIQCSERQARLFFHCSQYNGNLQDLKVGALFGAFNATGNCRIHFACVSEKYRLLSCWPYEILHFSLYTLPSLITSGKMFCLSTQLHSFPFSSCSLCFNSEDHMRVEYIIF
uniref:Cold shock domain containing E1 n=2 Tax=Homininae TaxID=207598 RepID=A0A2I3SJ28_PANTR